MRRNWLPVLGEFEERGGNLIFLGKEVEYTTQQEPQKMPAIGNALFSRRFAGGSVSATVEFAEMEDRTACELLLFYDPTNPFIVTAGLGGGYNMFNIRHFDSKNWTYHRQLGDRANLKAQRKYELAARVRGSRVSLSVDGVDVTSVDLPYNLPETQVGVWTMSRSRITISDFLVSSTKPSAFVVMPFSSPYNELYTDVIKRICKEVDLDVIRADEEVGPGIILADVVRKIVQSKVVIGEISSRNPNVYYEVGYAHALNKPTILIAQKSTELPFDVSPFRILLYEDTIHGKENLEDGLRKHLQAVLHERA
jgi:hypothetical protein